MLIGIGRPGSRHARYIICDRCYTIHAIVSNVESHKYWSRYRKLEPQFDLCGNCRFGEWHPIGCKVCDELRSLMEEG